jgi:hypothetical protein
VDGNTVCQYRCGFIKLVDDAMNGTTVLRSQSQITGEGFAVVKSCVQKPYHDWLHSPGICSRSCCHRRKTTPRTVRTVLTVTGWMPLSLCNEWFDEHKADRQARRSRSITRLRRAHRTRYQRLLMLVNY